MKSRTNFIAFVLLTIMALTSVFSMKGDSLTFDELAHIPAGYSYLTKQDYRVNPEHPPLIKDIPAIPLLFLSLNFPDDHPTWTQEEAAPAWWVQFDLGNQFLYYSGNNPREIIFWSRLAMIGLLILTGWFLFYWAKQIGGNLVALGTLSLFAFSPTFLAHGRLVNTDLGAVFGALIAIFFWLRFLKRPTRLNIFLTGIAFGIAMVLKFSLILLIPFFVIITFIWAVLSVLSEDPIIYAKNVNKILIPSRKSKIKALSFLTGLAGVEKKVFKSILIYAGKALLIALTGVIFVIWPIYQFHVWNYPPEQQLRDTTADISSHPLSLMRDMTIWMTKQEITRPLAQYLRGLLMASQRTVWGNTTFFMGEISASGWLRYFPLIYLFKVPLAFHLLAFFVLILSLYKLWQIVKNKLFFEKIGKNFTLFAFCIWIVIYWLAALMGNLNIGVRHLLPTFPFLYILVILGAVWLISYLSAIRPKLKKIAIVFVSFLSVWYIGSSLSVFPHYLSYYNELAGGTEQGYKIAVDSNYDWGQDFYRLVSFIEKNEIDKIYLDYFGGEDPQYWLGEKYIKLNPKEVRKPPKGWIAVSLNQYLGGIAEPAPGFDQETGYYNWLKDHLPAAKAGHSIFIYYLD